MTTEAWRDRLIPMAFGRALWRQLAVVKALVAREAVARRHHAIPFAFLLGMIEPLIIIGAICTLFILIDRVPMYGSSLVLFVASGVFPVYMFLYTSMGVRGPLEHAHIHRYPPEKPLDKVMAHVILHGVSSAAVVVLFFAGLYLWGEHQAQPFNPLGAITALSVMFWLGVGMGIFNTALASVFPAWNSLWPGFARASIHFSGLYFVADFLPPNIRFYFALNPLIHGVDWFRSSFYPFYPNAYNDKTYLLAMTVGSLFVGLVMQRVFREALQRSA